MQSNHKDTTTDRSFYEARPLDKEWNEELLRIAEETPPVASDGLRIAFDRSPDIFTIPELTSYDYRCGGLFKKNQLLGYAIAAFQRKYIGEDHLANVMYMGNMHATREGRGKAFYYRMSDFFFGNLPVDIEYFYAYIMERNAPAMDLINRRHPRFPNVPYTNVIGQISMVNILLFLPVRLSRKYEVRTATASDIIPIIDLLQHEHRMRFLAPAMDRNIFLQNLKRRPNFAIENYIVALAGDEMVGVCSAWDMTVFKKNRLLEYKDRFKLVHASYNMAALLVGAALLPKTGESFRDITIAEYAVKERNPEILNALLRYAHNRFRKEGYHSIIFGTSVDDPFLSATRDFFSKEIRSNVILGSKQKSKIAHKKNIPLIYADTVLI